MSETGTYTVEELLKRFKSDHEHETSASTTETHLMNLKPFREWLQKEYNTDLTDFGEREVRDHLNELKREGYANKTVAARFTAIQVFGDWLVDNEIIEESPTETLSSGVDTSVTRKQQELRSETPPAVTAEEKEQLCEHVPDPTLRNELMIRLMYQTGIRSKELRNIRLRDLDRDERSITIADAKSEKFRTVFYNDLEPWLTEWLDLGRRDSLRPADDSPYLFLTNRSEQLSINRPNDIIKDAAENAGIQETMYTDGQGNGRKRITCHALRHGFARHCIKEGMDISFLKDLMGHENLETTKQYLAFIDDDRREAVRKYGPSPSE